MQGQTFNTKLQRWVFCNHFPNLNTAFLHKCVAGWSQRGPAHDQTQGGSAVAIAVDSWGGCQVAVPFSLRATLQMGAAIKKRRKKKRPKYPESWVYNWLCLAAFFFMCEHSPGKNQWNPTLSPFAVPSYSVHPCTRFWSSPHFTF